jgi:uncharacterized protein DUF4932
MKHFIVTTMAGIILLACGCNGPTTPELVASPQPLDTSRVRIVIPEVYELANVIIAMTTFGQTNSVAVRRTGAYYQEVNATFSTFREHPSMRELQLGSSNPLLQYYEFRDNSSAYVFENGEIRRNAAASTSWSRNLFRDRRAAAQSFADASQFRTFFAANESVYVDQIARYRAAAEVDDIAAWLEREFPGIRYRHYTVVLSPLVYGSHSANFPSTNEAIFFVAGPDVTSDASTSPGVRKAVIQRILFTEIDHAFVNPVTDRNRSAVTAAFQNRGKWTTDESSFYDSPITVFNEYMTWAVFLLYAQDRLSEADFNSLRQLTVQQMEGSRRFQRFGAFFTQLLSIYRARAAGTTVADLFPQIITWARTN